MLKRINTFFVGLFCGTAVGAVLALILTPYSGEVLRLRSRQHLDYLLRQGAKAAEARRQELRAQREAMLASKTNP